MKLKALLKQFIKYEKELNKTKFSFQLLVISLISCFVITKYINIKEETLSNKNMELIIDDYLEQNILDIDIYTDEFNTDLIALGEVILQYMEKYNIDIIIIGDKYITKDGNDIKKITYIDNNKNIKEAYYLEEQVIIEQIILKEEVIKTMNIKNIAKYYNLVSTDNNFLSLKTANNLEQKITLVPKTN